MTAMADSIASLGANRALAQGITLALAAVCVVLAARLLWLVLAGPTLPVVPASAPAGGASPTARSAASMQGLFGQGASPVHATQTAPASRSGLVLRGTVAAADATRGVAFIAEGEGATDRAYRAGDSLPAGARLREVHADRVLIERGGTLESLALVRMGGPGTTPPRSTPPGRPATAGGVESDAVAASGGYLSAPINVGRPDLATARQARAPDLASLVSEANIVPVLEGERVIGVRLRLPDPALLERLGLSVEDVITQVNGIPLDGPERRSELEQSLQRGGPVQLTVRRDGIDRQLTIGL